ncbi:MAG: hypothetical protein LBP61_01885 [Desulfovibrio sp.]|nr:hypothetical protein [Desulfovibrio sp.]
MKESSVPGHEATPFSYKEDDPGFNKFRSARIWSNFELVRFAHLFSGTVCNVSAARDEDKEGRCYRNYFSNASNYITTNHRQDEHTDFALDLEAALPENMAGICDCVFNHTTLEHVYECRRAFASLCAMSRDAVIVVVPYIQQMHGTPERYADFWRFTPYTMQRMYAENGLTLRYCSANGAERTSIYLFCLGYRNSAWDAHIPERLDIALDLEQPLYGNEYTNIIGGNTIR